MALFEVLQHTCTEELVTKHGVSTLFIAEMWMKTFKVIVLVEQVLLEASPGF